MIFDLAGPGGEYKAKLALGAEKLPLAQCIHLGGRRGLKFLGRRPDTATKFVGDAGDNRPFLSTVT
jgi:hypothetical protein